MSPFSQNIRSLLPTALHDLQHTCLSSFHLLVLYQFGIYPVYMTRSLPLPLACILTWLARNLLIVPNVLPVLVRRLHSHCRAHELCPKDLWSRVLLLAWRSKHCYPYSTLSNLV